MNQAGCTRRIAKQDDVGVVLVKVEGLNANIVFNLRDELLQADGVGHGGADRTQLTSAELVAMTCWVLLLLCMLFLSQMMSDPDFDWRVLMSLAQSELL